MPVEGRLWADEPQLDSVHDLVHRREQRRGPCYVQGADGGEGGLAKESPRTARQVVLGGSVRLVRLRYRIRYQAPDGRLLRSAAGSACPGPSPPRRGMVLQALQSVAAGGGQGRNT